MKKAQSPKKAAAKNSIAPKKKETRGGARPGSGRAKYIGPMKQVHFDLPVPMIMEMRNLGIKNKTEYVGKLIIEDLKERGTKKGVMTAIEKALEKVKPANDTNKKPRK